MITIMETARRKQLKWIEAILAYKKWKVSNLTKAAGIDHSTLSKFLKDPTNSAQMNMTTVEKIALVSNIPPYETSPIKKPVGLAENEAEPYINDTFQPSISAAVKQFTDSKNGIDPWVMRSQALEHEGYLPGDILIVDLNATARDGDAVCAQVYDRSGRAETVMRIYEQPYLAAATSCKELRKPLLVDDDRVIIRGVIIASFRIRRSEAA